MLTISGIGRLGQEPKMQYTDKGTAITNLSVAADVGFGDKKVTAWIRLSAFSKQAELLNQYLSKCSRLVFTAEVTNIGTYSKKDGTSGINFDARILTFSFVDKSEQDSTNPYGGGNEPEDF